MNRERWKRLDELLDEALERQPTDRAAFLDKACVGDEILRKEVEALLRSDEQATGFIETPALEVAAEFLKIIEARLWAGLHYRGSTEAGVELGQKVAHYDLHHAFRAR